VQKKSPREVGQIANGGGRFDNDTFAVLRVCTAGDRGLGIVNLAENRYISGFDGKG